MEYNNINRLPQPTTTIAVDFDGTLVEHKFPLIGNINGNCFDILKHWIQDYNVGIILDTMRSGAFLQEAVEFCEAQGLVFYGIARHPTQDMWTESPKCHAHYSIDDRNVGCPLTGGRGMTPPRVDWDKIVEILEPTLKKRFEIGKY